MSIGVELARLISYSDHERAKWKAWVAADPSRLNLPFQAGGRFPTIGSLLDHVFLVERRHLSRLEGAVPPNTTGLAEGDWKGLFDYADLVRADFRHYAQELDDAEAAQVLTWTGVPPAPPGTYSMTRGKLTTHVLLHEVRHLAQIAFAVRLLGHEPPGEHDYFYCPEG
jgi:uncharacterized damage-inducible protein DinB